MKTLWFDPPRTRRFIIPDDAELPPGELLLRTSLGRERAVEESALAPFEVTAEEAQAWAKEQLGGVLGEVRGKALGFVELLRERTAALREENRRTWEQGVAEAPDEVREAAERVRAGLKELGQALQRAAREHGARPARPPSGASAGTGTTENGAASAPEDAGPANPPHPGAP
ncbi:MAG TPA: hypothetical protein VF613_07450 [Longimicrobium sp.]|jgi:hypothetical protein